MQLQRSEEFGARTAEGLFLQEAARALAEDMYPGDEMQKKRLIAGTRLSGFLAVRGGTARAHVAFR